MSMFEGTAWDPRFKRLGATAVIIMIGFSIMLWGGCGDLGMAMSTSAEPGPVSAHTLATEGPGDNYHVLVTDYKTSKEGVVMNGIAWFFVFPTERGGDQKSILLRKDVSDSPYGLIGLPEDGLQGLVRDGSGTMNADLRNAIKKQRRIDFDNFWIIELDRKPPGMVSILLKVVGGLAIVGVGALFFFLNLKDE